MKLQNSCFVFYLRTMSYYATYTEIYVPVMRLEEGLLPYSLDRLVQEVCHLSEQIYVKHHGENLAPIKIETISKVDKQLRALEGTTKVHSAYYKFYFRFTASLKVEPQKDNTTFSSFSFFFMRTVQQLFICLNIVKPGGFDTREGVIKTTYQMHGRDYFVKEKFPMLCCSLDEAFKFGETYKWPPIKELKTEVVKSILEQNWQAFETVPQNRLQRALNAFSYLFHDNLKDNSHVDLFYSLIGIEALYVEGKDGVQKQVDQKSQLLLGARTVFKKKFNELYDFRSRYIHGQLNFPNKYPAGKLAGEVEKHRNLNFENAALAILILVSSIQHLIELNKTEIEFELRMVDHLGGD